ncbi:hypothetical protein HYFRA_00007683 [Hymenoscyphus fraxineus]|uniref:Uncharacterized protein n=1 Tax=Hymenoscyphus fraxineus TaxID=746836 RepID=A0A9N9KVX0_9HELO|nr:hypothetical protein HYFRA_00007683 [Hymenoscyphus fraxineus]
MDSSRATFEEDGINEELARLNYVYRLEKYIVMNFRDPADVIRRSSTRLQRMQAMESEILKFHLREVSTIDSCGVVNSSLLEASQPIIESSQPTRANHHPGKLSVALPLSQFTVPETPNLASPSLVVDASASRKRPSSVASDSSGNKRAKLSNDSKTPCLRCKILKKKCDSEDQCAHCPQQSFDNENDYWKVLGCVRGQLRDVASVFCPDFARKNTRVLKCQSGKLLVVDFVLTKSRVSIGKKKRMLQLLQNRPDFAQLHDQSWSDTRSRVLLSQFAVTPTGACSEHELTNSSVLFEDYEAIWALLQTVLMDPVYAGATEYNVFTLLRLGNSCLKTAPASWEIFRQSKLLLRQAVELYLLERLCGHIASGDLTGSPPFDPTKLPQSNTLILVDIKEDMERFLESFERICAGRGKLSGELQLACFYALMVFSIVKGLLIDAYSVRNTCDDVSPWDETCALRINSAFKTLVSVFGWSSKQDIMLEYHLHPLASKAIAATQKMVCVEKWDERGFKTSRDFLLGLGSIVFANDSYNGFFKQKFGLEKFPIYVSSIQTPTRVNEGLRDNDSSSSKKITPFKVHEFPAAAHVEQDFLGNPDTISSDLEAATVPGNRRRVSLSPESDESQSLFTFIGYGEPTRRPNGGRRGELDQERLKKFRKLRKIGACWSCWALKVPVSSLSCCCITSGSFFKSGLLIETSGMFVGIEYFNSRFATEETDKYIDENIQDFTNQSISVTFAWFGQLHIELTATIFSPKPNSDAQKNYTGHLRHSLYSVRSLPIGLSPLDTDSAKKAINKYAEDVLASRFDEISFAANMRTDLCPESSKGIMKTIFAFYHARKEKDPLLHDVLLFYLNLSLMPSPIMFTQTSASSITAKLGEDFENSDLCSSRMLDRQIKHILFLENRKVLERVLGTLERHIRARNPSSWPTVFCTILILAYSIEALQSQAQIHFSTINYIPVIPSVVERETAKQVCQDLDDIPFAQLKYLFHAIYRTSQPDKGGINPFMQGNLATEKIGLDTPAREMIEGIRVVMAKLPVRKDYKLPEYGGNTSWGKVFSELNSGRLLGSFLAPFRVGGVNNEVTTKSLGKIPL